MRHRSGLRPEVVTFALYRHRAHCHLDLISYRLLVASGFPMSNVTAALCKHCWYQQMLRAFELADFRLLGKLKIALRRAREDSDMRGIQRFWKSRAHLVGGRQGDSL